MSRIPKFFRKKEQSTEETPTNDDVAPPEQELSGSNLKRSKSLRTPRPIVRSTFIPSTATLDPSDPESQVSHLQQPATLSRGVATSNPGSRASSPYVAQTDDARITTVVSPMAETTGGRQRSTSISARQVAHTRSRSVVMRAEKGGLSNQVVLGRSKTPTSMTRISNQQKLKRTNSVENALAADSPMATHPTKTPVKSPVTRTESSGSANGRVTSPLSRNDDPKGSKVSRVLVMGEGTADLNKLASEFSKSLSGEQEEVDGTSMSKSGSLTSSVGGASDSSPLSPSSSHTHLPTSHTSRSSLPAPRSIGPAKSLETSASKSRLAVPGLKGTPPNGGGGGAPTSRPGSAKAYYSVQITSHVDDQERPRSVTATIVPAPMGERRASDDSSPSSGRNTPLERRASAELDGSVKSSTSIDETLKASCETPRTPYRVPKVRTAFTVGGNEQMGLNDLEGSVLLEAEDYRRIAQEVKALKTTLLRFKRELQNEVCYGGGWGCLCVCMCACACVVCVHFLSVCVCNLVCVCVCVCGVCVWCVCVCVCACV